MIDISEVHKGSHADKQVVVRFSNSSDVAWHRAPKLANFPNGVTYQRNANFNTQTLLALDNTTPVSVSIDPFFFKVSG